MSVLNTISGASSAINIGGSALSLVGMGAALVTSNNPKPGIEGFLFDVPLSDNVAMSAQITDHFTEDNSAIQDHIAIDPLKITLTGKIAELVHDNYAAIAFASAVIERLTPLDVFTPQQALEAQKAIAVADQAASAVKSAKNALTDLYGVFSGDPAKNSQQKAFEYFEKAFLGRSLLSVQTPWKTYQNMAIESWSADQDDTNIFETTFTLTFKQMRFVGTQTNAGVLNGRIEQQKEPLKDSGAQNGKEKSFLATGKDAITGRTK